MGSHAFVHKFEQAMAFVPEELRTDMIQQAVEGSAQSTLWEGGLTAFLLAITADKLLAVQHTPESIIAVAAAYNE